MLWVKAVYGDKAADAWAKLKRRVLTVTPGWSEAYGLFTKGEAQMVLSYTTSPAYHIIAEGTERYQAASFAEGHYLQIEVAGMTANGAENPLARQFLAFMTGPGFQDVIPEDQLDVPGRQHRQAAQRGLRPSGEAGKDADLQPRRGRREPQGMGRRVAEGDERVDFWQPSGCPPLAAAIPASPPAWSRWPRSPS